MIRKYVHKSMPFKDESAKILEAKARDAGVNVVYQKSDHPTGRCAVLITGQDRSGSSHDQLEKDVLIQARIQDFAKGGG